MARRARCRRSRTRRCFMCCATISASTPRNSAAASPNAAPAPCWSTASRCAPASPMSRSVANSEITTLEGLGTLEKLASAAEGLHRGAGGAVRLLHRRHDHVGQGPARPPIRIRAKPRCAQGLAGNLCRCGTHNRIIRAVLRASPARWGGFDMNMLTRREVAAGLGGIVRRLHASPAPRHPRARPAAGAAARQPRRRTGCSTPGSASTPTAPRRCSPARSSSARASTTALAQIAAEELDLPLVALQ